MKKTPGVPHVKVNIVLCSYKHKIENIDKTLFFGMM